MIQLDYYKTVIATQYSADILKQELQDLVNEVEEMLINNKMDIEELFKKYAASTLTGVDSKLMNLKMFTQAVAEIISSPVEAFVSDDFCGDCRRKFNDCDEKITGQKSSTYGEYYNGKPICQLCVNKRYELAVADYESKNTH